MCVWCRYGADNVDCVVSAFHPLEWTVSEPRPHATHCLAKLVLRLPEKLVLGLHIASPNAGEIMQGYAVAFRRGDLKHSDLTDTVGIHPTITEEFTVMNVLKVRIVYVYLLQ